MSGERYEAKSPRSVKRLLRAALLAGGLTLPVACASPKAAPVKAPQSELSMERNVNTRKAIAVLPGAIVVNSQVGLYQEASYSSAGQTENTVSKSPKPQDFILLRPVIVKNSDGYWLGGQDSPENFVWAPLNSQDQDSFTYLTKHGLPHAKFCDGEITGAYHGVVNAREGGLSLDKSFVYHNPVARLAIGNFDIQQLEDENIEGYKPTPLC